jgi:hypothetical protein
MKENVSSLAPQIAGSLRDISQAGEEMKEAFQLADLDEAKYQTYMDRIKKIYDMQREGQRELIKDLQATRTGAVQRGGQAGLRQMPQMIGRAGAVAQQAGATGEAGAPISGLIGGIAGALGPVGMIIAGLSAVAVATIAIGRQYQKVLPTIIDVTAAFGELKKGTKDMTESFADTMDYATDATQKFGYNMEQGLEVMKTFARGGVTRGAAAEALGPVFAWARGMGVPPEALARYQAMGMRFGMEGNLFGVAAGGLRQAGMGLGQFQEYLDATLSVFEEGLSRGIVQGFGDINLAQTWIAQLGDAFKGQYGLNLFRKMDEAAVRGTELQSEQDVIVFRAARRLMKEQGMDTSNYIDVMKLMESGAKYTPALFGQIRNVVEEMTGGNVNDMTELFRQIFGVNYTVADKLVRLENVSQKQLDVLIAPKLPENSPQMTLLRTQQSIRNEIIGIGEHISVFEGIFINKLNDVVDTLKRLVLQGEEEGGGIGYPPQMGGAPDEEFALVYSVVAPGLRGRTKKERQAAKLTRDLMKQYGPGFTEVGFFERASERAIEYSPYEEMQRYGEREKISKYDLPAVLQALVETIRALNVNLTEEQIITIQNIIGEFK